MVPSKLVHRHTKGAAPLKGAGTFFVGTIQGREVMPLQPITPERVLDELACIAFADPRDPEALPVKIADKLRALELLYKHLGLGDGGGEEGVVIVDDVGKEEP